MLDRRGDFPILTHHPELVYLDNGASSQKLAAVLDAMTHFYSHEYANVHRGVYQLSSQATERFEAARARVADFFGVSANTMVLLRGATEAINLVADSFTADRLAPGDEIIISQMEHHANIVPWWRLTQRSGAKLVVIEHDEQGCLDVEQYRQAFNPRTKMVALTHVSNVLGSINPIHQLGSIAHEHGVPILIDGAQGAPHLPVNLGDCPVDFYTASAHKMYGPNGIGFLYVRPEHLASMRPYQVGGNMIAKVAFDQVTYAEGVQRFEAGTMPIAEVIGFAAALDALAEIGMQTIEQHENHLLQALLDMLAGFQRIRIYGHAAKRAAIVSFSMEGVHPHDVATLLDRCNIAVRAGQHCAMPLLSAYGEHALTRVSLGLNNVLEDIGKLEMGLRQVERLFHGG